MSVMAESFVIDQYDVNIAIQGDGSLEIQEIIDVTFSEPKHGIERKLPSVYQYDSTRNQIINYQDISSSTQYRVYSDGPDEVVRLGDPDVFVDGAQSYTIQYLATP
jgi:hypothetical protein